MCPSFEPGEEVISPGLLDIVFTVEGISAASNNVRLKYYDEFERKVIKLSLPAHTLLKKPKGSQVVGHKTNK